MAGRRYSAGLTLFGQIAAISHHCLGWDQHQQAGSTPLGAIDTTWMHRVPQKPLIQSSNRCQCLQTVSMSLGNSAVQVRKPPLRPTRPQHLPPGQVLQVGNLLNLTDNPLSSAQFRQLVAQLCKPTTQGHFIYEA